MEKRELKVMWNYYLGMSRVPMIWEKELEQLHRKKAIKKIYEVIDYKFNEIWYLIRDSSERSYIIKAKYGNIYAKDVMKKYRAFYDFYKISTEIINIFEKGIYPIVFKISEDNFDNLYDKSCNKSNAFFNNYYCISKNKYKAVREYRNKIEYEVFDREEDAIYWASDYSKLKEDILKNNIRPLNLFERVYEYRAEKG